MWTGRCGIVAVPGYNTSQELSHLEEIGPQFAPDLVIVGSLKTIWSTIVTLAIRGC